MPIVKAISTDTGELVDLINSAYRGETSKSGWTSESHLLEGSRIDTDTIAGYLSDPAVDILKYLDHDGVIKGCVYLELKADSVYLGMLTVSPWQQNKGIGRELLAAADDYCRKKQCIGLQITVITTRLELIDWYKRRGFYETGEIRPFRVPEKFGKPKQPIELTVMNKDLNN